MRRNQRIKAAGFTLVETVVTLAIVVSIILIPTLKVHDFQNQAAQQQFLTHFKTEWTYAKQYCLVKHSTVDVRYNPQIHAFIFVGNSADYQRKSVQLPADLELENSQVKLKIDHEKSINPTSLKFYQKQTGKHLALKIQFKWGAVVETK